AVTVSSAQVMAAVSGVDERQTESASTLIATELAQQNQQKTTNSVSEICRMLSAPGGIGETRVCDTAEHWADFESRMMSPEDLAALNAMDASEDYVIEIEYQVCRFEKQRVRV